LKFEAEGQDFAKFEITRTIYSNSESSEQFLSTECFLTCFWRFLISKICIRTIRIQIGKKYWHLETCRKSEKIRLIGEEIKKYLVHSKNL
jgi:hypothetical protein